VPTSPDEYLADPGSTSKVFSMVGNPLPTSFRAGYDLVLVASLRGHARIETVRIYTLPTDDDIQAAVDHITVDY
jgi:hypothetical protein